MSKAEVRGGAVNVMGGRVGGTAGIPGRWSGERNCYLTTTGRVTGNPHEIEIWFALYEGRVYLISGRGEHADWVKNLRDSPNVSVRVGDDEREGTAQVVEDGEDVESGGGHPARRVWAEKYGRGHPTSLLVEITLPQSYDAG